MHHLFDMLAVGAIDFALRESTLPGKIIILVLFVASIFSWSIMVTKFRVVRHARRQNELFLADFHSDRAPLRIHEAGRRYAGAPLFHVYRTGCRELTFHLLGSVDVDETFQARLRSAQRITSAQMRAVQTAMERAVGEAGLRLESQMILLATAVSASPFLGLLGTVWGVMDTFSGVAIAGSANLQAMAPGVSASLLTTVTALLVAIPAMFGYNYLVSNLKTIVVQMDNFAAELASEMEHQFVSHSERRTPVNTGGPQP